MGISCQNVVMLQVVHIIFNFGQLWTRLNGGKVVAYGDYAALIWQKEASDKSDISRKRAKCVCHLHWRQWNIMMSYLTYLLVGWVFLHEIWPGRRAHYVNYENINNSNLDGMSLASFCQSRAVRYTHLWQDVVWAYFCVLPSYLPLSPMTKQQHSQVI